MRIVLALFVFVWAGAALADSTLIGVVVTTETSTLRRVIVPDSDEQLMKQSWAGKGETLLIMPRDADIDQQIEKQTGIAPTLPLAAVVNGKGEVEQMIMADPVLDVLPGKEVVRAYDGVKEGSKYDAETETFTTDDVPVEVKEPKPVDDLSLDKMLEAIPQ